MWDENIFRFCFDLKLRMYKEDWFVIRRAVCCVVNGDEDIERDITGESMKARFGLIDVKNERGLDVFCMFVQ